MLAVAFVALVSETLSDVIVAPDAMNLELLISLVFSGIGDFECGFVENIFCIDGTESVCTDSVLATGEYGCVFVGVFSFLFVLLTIYTNSVEVLVTVVIAGTSCIVVD